MNIYKEFERLINFGLKHKLFEKKYPDLELKIIK